MDEKDKNLLIEFRNKLPSDIKSHLKRLIAFGSRARGNALVDSDLDVLALIDQTDPFIQKKMNDEIYQVMLEHDFIPIISLKILSESKFQSGLDRGFSFYKNVANEGIVV